MVGTCAPSLNFLQLTVTVISPGKGAVAACPWPICGCFRSSHKELESGTKIWDIPGKLELYINTEGVKDVKVLVTQGSDLDALQLCLLKKLLQRFLIKWLVSYFFAWGCKHLATERYALASTHTNEWPS